MLVQMPNTLSQKIAANHFGGLKGVPSQSATQAVARLETQINLRFHSLQARSGAAAAALLPQLSACPPLSHSDPAAPRLPPASARAWPVSNRLFPCWWTQGKRCACQQHNSLHGGFFKSKFKIMHQFFNCRWWGRCCCAWRCCLPIDMQGPSRQHPLSRTVIVPASLDDTSTDRTSSGAGSPPL